MATKKHKKGKSKHHEPKHVRTVWHVTLGLCRVTELPVLPDAPKDYDLVVRTLAGQIFEISSQDLRTAPTEFDLETKMLRHLASLVRGQSFSQN